MKGGQYCHLGITSGLEICFKDMMQPNTIEININIDGLTIYKSSHDQFWPILFNVHKMPHIKPMAITIFFGKSKPEKIEEYLAPFVNEIEPILKNGLIVNGHTLSIKIRAIICDTPARSFIKSMSDISVSNLKCLKLILFFALYRYSWLQFSEWLSKMLHNRCSLFTHHF